MTAGLPSFAGLVKAVLTELLPPRNMCRSGSAEGLAWLAFQSERYDEALDILETPRGEGFEAKDVRACVRAELARRTKTLDHHHTLARLADLDRPTGRLVTTNFDHLFERAQAKLRKQEGSTHKLKVHVAPALPPAMPDKATGLVYLHGRLGETQDERGLVLTTADFGTAYMLEGWARRFVVEMFRHYHVVFLGYRVEDPTMRYLVSALAAAREENKQFKDAYAFAGYGLEGNGPEKREEAEQEWKIKGLLPLPYSTDKNHQELWDTLEHWANDHRQGVLGRRQSVAKLGQFPPVEENDPTIAELVWALGDDAVAKHFADLDGSDRPHPGWIAPLDRSGMFDLSVSSKDRMKTFSHGLVSWRVQDGVPLSDGTNHLARWIAKCLDNAEVLSWAIRNGGALHEELRWHVRRRLESAPPVGEAFQKIWRVLADDNYAYALSLKARGDWFEVPKVGPDEPFGNSVLLERLRPIPIFALRQRFADMHSSSPDPNKPSDWYAIEVELVGIRHAHDLERFQEASADWRRALATLADGITTRLVEALEWFKEFGLASAVDDPGHWAFRSISAHDQDRHADGWTFLISLARDSYDALVDIGDKEGARRLSLRWHTIPFPTFRRLTLYAASGGRHA